MKILIVKLGAIGDIIHTLPALAMIRRSMPAATIGWVAERRSAEILRGNPLIDELIEVDTRSLRGGNVIEKMLIDGTRQMREVRRFEPDISIDFQGLMKSGFIPLGSGAGSRWGFATQNLREASARFFYTDAAAVPEKSHVIRQNLGLARAALKLDIDDPPIEFPIGTSTEDTNEADEVARAAGPRFAILNPAGGWVTKLWHPEKYGRLADLIWEKFGMRSVVVSGPNEAELASKVVEGSRSGTIVSATPSLKGFYELAKRASVYIGGDTGPTHLAIAAGTPVVGIFGPTEWWRNGSLDPDDVCVERLDIGCRVDCHRRTCSQWICMEITPETVLDAVSARLKAKELTVAGLKK